MSLDGSEKYFNIPTVKCKFPTTTWENKKVIYDKPTERKSVQMPFKLAETVGFIPWIFKNVYY